MLGEVHEDALSWKEDRRCKLVCGQGTQLVFRHLENESAFSSFLFVCLVAFEVNSDH